MLAEHYKIVPVMKEADISSTVYTDSIDMRAYHEATYIFQLTALGGASAALTFSSGATNAAVTSTLYFNYAFGGAAIGTAVAASTASCDVLAAWTNANTLTLTYGTYSTFMLVCELDATVMDIANGEYFLTGTITTAGSVTGTVSAFAILKPRYASNRIATCLA